MRIAVLIFSILISTFVFGQKTKVRLKHADRAKGTKINGEDVNKLYGKVHLQKDDVDFYCDSAIRYTKRNDFEAFGNVRMIQGDSIKLYCDKLFHNGTSGISKCRGDVVLTDNKMKLKTSKLDFDRKRAIAYYYDWGKVYDGKVYLVSERGFYSTKSKVFRFYDQVLIRREGNTIYSDTVRYNRISEVAYFEGPTKILSETDSLYAERGEYHTETEDAYFSKSAYVETPKYILRGDSVWYNNSSENGYMEGKAVIHSKLDSVFVMGNIGQKRADLGRIKVYGPETLLQKYDKTDTVFIMADTLLTVEDTAGQQSEIYAFNNVEILKGNVQGMSDSLLYALKDSTICFFTDPVVWADSNQISGDTIRVLFQKNKIHRIFTDGNSFTIKFHHVNQYDQIKGRKTVAHFADNDLKKVKVYGNGECLYYVNNEDEKEFTGVNMIECSSMNVYFAEGKLSDISFVTLPKAQFYPPRMLNAERKFLSNFNWRWDEKPLREEFEEVLYQYFPKPVETVIPDKPEEKQAEEPVEKEKKGLKKIFKKKKI